MKSNYTVVNAKFINIKKPAMGIAGFQNKREKNDETKLIILSILTNLKSKAAK